jgi:site-specific DNA recombinase
VATVSERLGYKTIAKRLNRDPGSYPPPIPNRPAAAKGGWTEAAVADLLQIPSTPATWCGTG